MAYRRKTRSSRRKTYGRKTSYKRRATPKRRVARKGKRKTASKRSHQRITLVIQHAPAVSPTLATPASKGPPQRARFGG